MTFRAWGPLLFWMGLIFFLSDTPDPPNQGVIFGFDWIPHLGVYLVFGILLARFFSIELKRRSLGSHLNGPLSSFTGIFYAFTDELHQYFVPSRAFELKDLLVDSLGVFLGILLWPAIEKLFPLKDRRDTSF